MKPATSVSSTGALWWLRSAFCLCLFLAVATTALAAPRQKVIFDCDLAGDVDDACAVALLLTSPEFEVLGLVMDHGNTWGRARVAGRLLCDLRPVAPTLP